MKKSFLLYLIMSVFLIGYCACDNDEENFDTATTGQVIKVPDDIKSFNSVTKEIVFEKNISIKQDVLGNEKVEFRIAVLQNEVRNQEERDENMQKIEKAWSNFLKVLNEAGKLK